MKILERSEMPIEDTWRLEDIFASEADWDAACTHIKEETASISSYAGTLGKSAESLAKALAAQSSLSLSVERVYAYACMKRDQDNGNSQWGGMADRATTLAVAAESATSFYLPELMAIDETSLRSWMELPLLASYHHQLDDILRYRAHTLSEAEEKLLAMAGDALSAPQNVYRILDNAELPFPQIEMANGEAVQLSHGNFIHILEQPERDLRKEAFGKFYDTYHDFRGSYAATLSGSIKGDVFSSTARHFPSSLSAALFEDNVPESVYSSLIDAVHEKLPVLHRYMELRKKAMHLDELEMYDIYAPLSQADFRISYPEAQQLVLDGLAPLGEDYGQLLQKAFADRWIDVYENKGKSSGAYSWGCYGSHPFVLLNYQPGIDSVFTLAHELGHSLHSYFSDEAQDYNNAQYRIFVAEVASTVNEVLLMQYLLSKETDKMRRMRLLNYYCEQFRTTVYRQVMFSEFESILHEQAENGEALTADVLESVYGDLNTKYYGPAMNQSKGISMEWARISHFYNAFYVYKYATGFSSAVALSQSILDNGAPAVEKYRNFLRSGGSDYPIDLLRNAGVDLRSPEPVKQALEVFSQSLDELESLLS